MKKILNILLWPWHRWQEHKEYKARLKELRKRDPFIYR